MVVMLSYSKGKSGRKKKSDGGNFRWIHSIHMIRSAGQVRGLCIFNKQGKKGFRRSNFKVFLLSGFSFFCFALSLSQNIIDLK